MKAPRPRRSRMPFVFWLALLAGAGPLAGQDFHYEEMTLPGGEMRTFVKYKRVKYVKIDPKDLTDKNPRYRNQMVCFEVKFDTRDELHRTFTVVGQPGVKIVYEKVGLSKVVDTFVPGENVWLGGRALKFRAKPGCYLYLTDAVKLKDDRELFFDRMRENIARGNWRGLIELGKEFEKRGRLNPNATFRDLQEFKRLQKRAFRTALEIGRKKLRPGDAQGRYELAILYLELLDNPLRARQLLRECAKINPRHRKATARLQEYGYEEYEGDWLLPAEIERRKKQKVLAAKRAQEAAAARERERQQRERADRQVAEDRRREQKEILRLMVQTAGLEGLASVRQALNVNDEALGRLVVRKLAGDISPDSLTGLSEAMKSTSPEVRKDVADALAFKGNGEARAFLDMLIEGEKDPDVAKHGVDALQWLGDAEAVEQLIKLLPGTNVVIRAHIGQVLEALTQQDHGVNQDAWNAWWKQGRATYELPARN